MKKIITLFIAILLISCSKDDDSTSTEPIVLSDAPAAKEQYNSSNFGIYKGIFVGSSGRVTIDIKNTGTVSATIVIDGTRYNFTTTETVTENADIFGLTFTNGNKKFDFSCSGNGDNIVISDVVFPGHEEASINVLKEYSDNQVMCYQGTFTGGDHGVFNLIIANQTVHGLARSLVSSHVLYIDGDKEGTTISGTMENGTFSGSIFGNNVSGVWQNNSQDSGTWTAKRTL